MRMRVALVTVALGLAGRTAAAEDALTITEVRVDRATLHAAGVQVRIAGDDDRDATIRVRYVELPIAAGAVWREAPPLVRVRPETVTGRVVPAQLAGSLFDLDPGRTYDVELVVDDPDGGSETRHVTVTTRSAPRDPALATQRPVATTAQLQAALAVAQPGDVIVLADAVYAGPFTLAASGTEAAPIVLRGINQTAAILDGGGCTACDVLAIAGSHVHVERLTVRDGARALGFTGEATTANAVIGVRIENVVDGIGAAPAQTAFTLCDNTVRGRLTWPLIDTDDAGLHTGDQGIGVDGDGHVVCHNEIAGFGAAVVNVADGSRAFDVYGNEIHDVYGAGTTLDRGEGNVRLVGNRYTNVATGVSIQPAYGGPVYVLRNQVVNVARAQLALATGAGTSEPAGVHVHHNTFVSPRRALDLQSTVTQHDSVITNNLFIGPAPTAAGRTVEWTAPLDSVVFDSNGYAPDEGFWFGTVGAPRTFASLAAAQAAGIEVAGRVLVEPVFEPTFPAPATYTTALPRAWLQLASTSNAVDAGRVLVGINTLHAGTAPDLGASERGCPEPDIGPRTPGARLQTIRVDCAAPPVPPPGGIPGDDLPVPAEASGCCQASRAPHGTLALAAALGLVLRRRRRAIA